MGKPISTSWTITDSSNMGAVGGQRLEPPAPTQPCLLHFVQCHTAPPCHHFLASFHSSSVSLLFSSFATFLLQKRSLAHRHPREQKDSTHELGSPGSSLPSKPLPPTVFCENKIPLPVKSCINPSSAPSKCSRHATSPSSTEQEPTNSPA